MNRHIAPLIQLLLMGFKKIIKKLHLVLGLVSGIIIVFLGITGCIMAFQDEIESLHSYRYVEQRNEAFLPPSVLQRSAISAVPGKPPHSVEYGGRGDAARVSFYQDEPEYYYIVYIDPYTGIVKKVKNMEDDFFRIILDGHFYLWLPPAIGQPIVASATLVFLVMIISGIILWWPKNKAARKQRFSIKRNASWKRINYDLHSVLGFYACWAGLLFAVTGLVWGFQWFARSVYWTSSFGKAQIEYYEPASRITEVDNAGGPAIDRLWLKMKQQYNNKETIEMHYPETDTSTIVVAINPNPSTYYKMDYRFFDQYSLAEIPVTHSYGIYAQAKLADKLVRMNYDIHTGAIIGLTGKVIAFFTSLIITSLPITGFYIWWGRMKKNRPPPVRKNESLRSYPLPQVH